MKKQILILFIAIVFTSLLNAQRIKPIGSDRDKHGCIGSAGYTFSVVKNNCIRLFEEKIRLTETNPKDSYTSSTIVILSDDKNKAEIFLPTSKGSYILDMYTSSKNMTVYKKGPYLLIKEKNTYILKKSNKIIFNS